MQKFEIEVVNTDELSTETIVIINRLKNQYWKHEEDEHMRWFKANMFPDDIHILIKGRCLLAYLNMVCVDIKINQKPFKVLGIGNVCVNTEEEHMGFGAILLSTANALIKRKNTCGMLLCHDNVKSFYLKLGWDIYNAKEIRIEGNLFEYIVMTYDPYHILPLNVDDLIIYRNF